MRQIEKHGNRFAKRVWYRIGLQGVALFFPAKLDSSVSFENFDLFEYCITSDVETSFLRELSSGIFV